MMFAGDASRDKGIEVLLKAYAALPPSPPLVVIGRRVERTPEALPPNVVYLGPWPHEAVLEAWRRCIFALVPSVWAEPFGLVALEAMAAGCPVIASATGGLLDIVVDGETGLLVPAGDAMALRDAMSRLLASRELAAQMGAAGKRRAAKFTASAVAPQVEQAYHTVLAQRQRAGRPSLPASGTQIDG
jgi:glycosyltransferase involved in cell wall biosynthesis